MVDGGVVVVLWLVVLVLAFWCICGSVGDAYGVRGKGCGDVGKGGGV